MLATMRIRDRSVGWLLVGPFKPHQWRALAGIITTISPPWEALRCYIAMGGNYPWTVTPRTPIGPVSLELEDYHDLLTTVEVFCRRGYGAEVHPVVVDIGANVGIATLFFLTRDPEVRVYAYEPDPREHGPIAPKPRPIHRPLHADRSSGRRRRPGHRRLRPGTNLWARRTLRSHR